MQHKLVFSIKEAAELLGVHENTLRKRVQDGSIPSRKLGNRVLIPVSALRAWLEADTDKNPAGVGGKR